MDSTGRSQSNTNIRFDANNFLQDLTRVATRTGINTSLQRLLNASQNVFRHPLSRSISLFSGYISHSSQHMLISAYRGVTKTPKARLILLITGSGGSSFSAVSDIQALNVTLPFGGEWRCVCVPVQAAGSVTLEQRDACVCVVDGSVCLNFLSEPLPDVKLPRAGEGGAACLPPFLF